MLHKFVLWIFETLINIEKFVRVVCLFLIMFISLYWIQNLIGASWWWMKFISPILDVILDFVNSLYSFTFDFWGKSFEIKYFNAIALIAISIGGLKLFDMCVEKARDFYETAYIICKKKNEKIFNTGLQKVVEIEMKPMRKYMVCIKTRLSKKYVNKLQSVNLEEQNVAMNKFLREKTKTKPENFAGGFLYCFNDIENIDKVLDVIFRLFLSEAPIDYAISIQLGDFKNCGEQLKKLTDLEEWNKVIMTADTLCRYNYNGSRNYNTESVGIFQNETGTIEVHEFKQKS